MCGCVACGFAFLHGVFGCLISYLRGDRFTFHPLFGKPPERAFSPLSAYRPARTNRTPRAITPSPPPEIAECRAPYEAQSGRGGAALRSGSPPSPRERIGCLGWGVGRRVLLPRPPDARAGPACACSVVCVCVSLMQTLPPQTDPPNSLPFHTNLETGF